MSKSDLTPDEVDHVMANIHPQNRRWCVASCGLRPGDDPEVYRGFACACSGCIGGYLTWEEFSSWQEREAHRDHTPYIEDLRERDPLTVPITERLEAYKSKKRT